MTVIVFAAGLALMYSVKATGTLRISEAGEREGIDIHEHGAPVYHPEPAYTGIAPGDGHSSAPSPAMATARSETRV